MSGAPPVWPTPPATPPAAPSVRAPALPHPPWLWLYLVTAAVYVAPGTVRDLREEWGQIDALHADVGWWAEVYRLFLVALFVPPLLIAAGLVLAAVPALRRALVEYGHPQLQVDGPAGDVTRAALADMQAFVDRHSTGVEIRLTLYPGDARIYPTSLRRARIAVSPTFVHLWAGHPSAVRAVLLHEIGHRRQGEHLVGGLGSPLGWLVRVWAVSFPLLTAAPLALLAVAGRDLLAIAGAPELVRSAARPLQVLIFPVTALWLAELSADAWAARVAGPLAVREALQLRDALRATAGGGPGGGVRGIRGTGRGWPGLLARARRTLHLLDHPPAPLRCTLLGTSAHPTGATRASAVPLIGWPLAVAAAFVVSVAAFVPQYLLVYRTTDGLATELARGALTTLTSSLPATLGAAVLLLAWPWLGAIWPRLWEPGPLAPATRPSAAPLLLAACLPATLALGALVPAPAAELPPIAVPASVTSPDGVPQRGDGPVVLRVRSVTGVQEVTGAADGQIGKRLADALLAARWTLNGDGTFSVDAPTSAGSPLGSVRGTWLTSASQVMLQGSGAATMTGLILWNDDPRSMQLYWTLPADSAGADGDPAALVPRMYRIDVQLSH